MRIQAGGSREATYYALEEAYESLIRSAIDWVVPLVADDGEPITISPFGFPEGFAGQLARFSRSSFIYMAPKIGLIQVQDRDSPLAYAPPEVTGLPLGRLIAATPMTGADRGASTYSLAPLIAASVAVSPRDRGLSGVQVTGVHGVNPEYTSETVMAKKARAGLLILEETVRRGWAVYRAVTQDPDGPSLSSMRAAADILWRIRYSLTPFIGQPQNPQMLASEHEAVQEAINSHPWVVDPVFQITRTGIHDQSLTLELGFRNEVNRLELYARLPRSG